MTTVPQQAILVEGRSPTQSQGKVKPTELEFRELKQKASEWARQRLDDPNTVIVDIETTGLPSKDPDVEICQVSVINVSGRPLFSMLVKPNKPMGEEVINVHKIRNEEVINQPTFAQIAKMLSFVLKGKHVVCYNSAFDIKILWSLFKKYNLDTPDTAGISCAMEKYSEFKMEWNESKGNLKWHKLPKLAAGEAHDSLVDCVSTLKLLRLIAGDFNPAEVEAEEISLNF